MIEAIRLLGVDEHIRQLDIKQRGAEIYSECPRTLR